MVKQEQKTITVDRDPDSLLQAAMSLGIDAYRAHVRDLADEIAGACRDGEITTTDQLNERIHETCDGDGWVIYTARAQMVLLVSDNDGAYVDNFGTEGMADRNGINWSVLAFAALEADLYERLDSMELDVNDPESWKPTDDE